jgi:orotate phosphoribosyltransferase
LRVGGFSYNARLHRPPNSNTTHICMYHRNELAALIREKALRLGDFTLASGKKAKYYLDCKQVTLDPAGARLVAEGILDLLADGPLPDAVGGMAIGADPITAAVVTMSSVRGTPIRGFMIRKESKGHGTNQHVEGPVQPGNQCVIVEDVVTTGGSSLAAIERAEAFGLKVVRVIGIVDRMEGGRGAFEQRGYRFASLFDIRDFGIEPPPAGG